jgi:hypothetical protein
MTDTLVVLFTLLVVYQLKHFIADFPLQGEYMLRKFSSVPSVWVVPLAAHAGVHAIFTLFIAGYFVGGFFPFALAAFDFVMHFTMDRVKASPNLMGRWKNLSVRDYVYYKDCAGQAGAHPNVKVQTDKIIRGNTYFWWALGFDQMFHHLTHYIIIACIISH